MEPDSQFIPGVGRCPEKNRQSVHVFLTFAPDPTPVGKGQKGEKKGKITTHPGQDRTKRDSLRSRESEWA